MTSSVVIVIRSKYPVNISYQASTFVGHNDPQKTKLSYNCTLQNLLDTELGSALILVRQFLFNFLRVKSGSVGWNPRWMLMRYRGSGM